MVFTDRKDFSISSKQSNTGISKQTFSSKNENDATYGILFSIAIGFVVEKSPNFAGRARERQIVQLIGLCGPSNASTRE